MFWIICFIYISHCYVRSIIFCALYYFVSINEELGIKNGYGLVRKAKRLLSESWPLILSGVALMLYMRIDQIMIGNMINDSAVGVYSVAVKMAEVWYFVPAAVVSSLFPR